MKAVVSRPVRVARLLRVEEIPVPSPGAGQVRDEDRRDLSQPQRLGVPTRIARVRADRGTAVPGLPTLGSDIAGLVDDVGEG